MFLLLGALGWGASLVFVLLPQAMAFAILESYGLVLASPDPLLVYWLRMAGGGFTMIGALFFVAFLRPQKYAALIPLLAYLSLFEALVLVLSALRLDLQLFPWIVDAAFSFIVGTGLFLTRHHAESDLENQ